MNKSDRSDKLFAKTVLQRFLKVSSIKSFKCKLAHVLSSFQNDALKNLFI